MSYLEQCLLLFDFDNIDNVTKKSLKSVFRKKMLEIHPDKGGDAEDFDILLSSFLYLNETINRINGGRDILSGILEPDDLLNMRNDEILHEIFQELGMEEFHRKFEEKESELLKNGYDSWFRNSEDSADIPKIEEIQSKNFNEVFKNTALKGKEITELSLHLNDMATYNSTIGTAIIETDTINYTSQFGVTPEYTDLYSAYTENNIIMDKIPESFQNRTLEEIIKEREEGLKPITDSEKEALNEYEKKEYEKQKKHYSNLQGYFGDDYNGGISMLSNSIEKDGFVKEF